MQARYRSDYPGEFVILTTRWHQGRKDEEREWIANPIENHHISGRAACISSDIDRSTFDYTRLQKHRGGLLGSKKLQTYGTGVVAHNMRLDFAVETHASELATLIENKYYENNIVYTTARKCVENPGLFYLIPQNPNLLDLVTAAYLAAFDGHKEIFLLGYNKDTPVDNTQWVEQLIKLFNAYSGTKFFMVGEKTNMPAEWFDCANVSHFYYREFIGYCDV